MFTFLPNNSASSSVNSLQPSDTMWHCRPWLTLAEVMAYCLMAPSHYLRQCWQIISVRSSHIPLRAILQEMLKIFILDMSLKIIYLYLPGANQSKYFSVIHSVGFVHTCTKRKWKKDKIRKIYSAPKQTFWPPSSWNSLVVQCRSL